MAQAKTQLKKALLRAIADPRTRTALALAALAAVTLLPTGAKLRDAPVI